MPDRRRWHADLMRASRAGEGSRSVAPARRSGPRTRLGPPASVASTTTLAARRRAGRPPRKRRGPRRPGRVRGMRAARCGRGTCSATPRTPGPSSPPHQSGGAGIEPVHDPGPERAAGRSERDPIPSTGSRASRRAAGGGCVTTPAGFTITTRCSSSYRIGTEGPSGAIGASPSISIVSRSPHGGGTTWTVAPRRRAPSLRRSLAARPRAPRPVIVATTASSRPSSASSVSLTTAPPSSRAAPSRPLAVPGVPPTPAGSHRPRSRRRPG